MKIMNILKYLCMTSGIAIVLLVPYINPGENITIAGLPLPIVLVYFGAILICLGVFFTYQTSLKPISTIYDN